IHAFFHFVASRNPEHLELAQRVLGIPPTTIRLMLIVVPSLVLAHKSYALTSSYDMPPSLACYVESCHGVDSKVDSKHSSREPGFSGWFTVHFAVKTHGFGWTQ